jgi:hypothetical protein
LSISLFITSFIIGPPFTLPHPKKFFEKRGKKHVHPSLRNNQTLPLPLHPRNNPLERSPSLKKKRAFHFFSKGGLKKIASHSKKIIFVKVESYPSSLPTQKLALLKKEKTLPNSFPILSLINCNLIHQVYFHYLLFIYVQTLTSKNNPFEEGKKKYPTLSLSFS